MSAITTLRPIARYGRVGSAADQAASAQGLAVHPEAIGVVPRAASFDWC